MSKADLAIYTTLVMVPQLPAIKNTWNLAVGRGHCRLTRLALGPPPPNHFYDDDDDDVNE